MPISEHSPRYFAAITIGIVHAAAIYAAATLAPSSAAKRDVQPLAIHFVTEAAPPEHTPPPEPLTITPVLHLSEPLLPALELPEPAAEERPNAPQLITASLNLPADNSAPKLISTVEYVRQPSPHYPPQSRRLKEQGVVVLRVLIDERGHACDIAIESSSGYARLDHAAREAVESAVFRPYVEDGAPRRAFVLIPIEFFIKQAAA